MGATEGDRLGPYHLLSTLGAGGFGEVHLALDPDGRTVAVKILHPHVAADATALSRLAREVETMRRVQGPHVAEVLDASMEGTRPYLVTRYVQGRPLSALIAAEGAVVGDDLVRLAHGLARALAAVHAADVVHRDLKPANVIMADGEPVVIDFGIASALDSASVTASGTVVGTPGYLAPEVIEGGQSGPAADLFSFGTTLAHAATGRHPYGTGPASAVGYRVVHHEPDLEGVPGWLEPVLRECMRRDPAARPTAAQVLERLGIEAPEVGEVFPRPRRAFAVPGLASGPSGSSGGGAVETGVHALSTRQWRPGQRPPSNRLSPEEALRRRRVVVHRRWVVGTGLLTALAAATARTPLPELSLLLLVSYGLVVIVDGGIALLARKDRGRAIVDLAGGAGAVILWAVLGTFFSTLTLALALGTVLFVLVAILVSS
ncbi:serine/threonine-protein kinase [Streptosporangium saharense]|uniref:Serine/threonine protein kinase n=1 Tax=Streptosporangium saharense TaxID=1706840 RepID=A0A7W7VQG0_9ACTN|nr:serine/threonine-protein kinase [Streptosporangium saharense]MBB4918703.1 serine/threonine protein kinase [Streptosporangium saharense]